jgi:hypothetical protein
MKTYNEPSIPRINLTADDFIFGIRFEDGSGKATEYD